MRDGFHRRDQRSHRRRDCARRTFHVVSEAKAERTVLLTGSWGRHIERWFKVYFIFVNWHHNTLTVWNWCINALSYKRCWSKINWLSFVNSWKPSNSAAWRISYSKQIVNINFGLIHNIENQAAKL